MQGKKEYQVSGMITEQDYTDIVDLCNRHNISISCLIRMLVKGCLNEDKQNQRTSNKNETSKSI